MIAAEVEQDLAQLAHAGQVAELKQRLQRIHPADVAEAVIDLPSQE
jgi:Mg/Co/Ni transporter MgtE